MEYLKTYYSLENHLEETIKYNPQFEILNAIWKLNKRNLSSALSNTNQYYPHYSLHEQSHSSTIISNIESFLGEDRIKRLSPTDTWLLLMASFTHDLGMVVFHEVVESEWGSQNFQMFLQEISEWDDADMKVSGELLIRLQQISKTQDFKDYAWLATLSPIKVKNSVTLAVSEYMRRIHHKRSSDILKGVDQIFFQVASSFYSDQIPNRLLTILAEVAYLHGVEFYDIFSRLDHQANGIANDKVHPRFIAAMLRLGDLLDIDDSRFNIFTEKVFKFPETSLGHKRKHSSVKHFLVTPEAIEITSDCPDDNVYRLARNWYDWLESEVQNQSREWANLAPRDLGGSTPRIPRGKIKVFYNGSNDDSLLNLKFQISNEKIFGILEGASLYERAEFTFIRELVQNALDASKIQLWKEIESGTYDFAFRQYHENDHLSHDEIIELIRFPKDIPSFLTESYFVLLSLDWKNEDKEEIEILVEDFGTGISDANLIRMTSKVGESRKRDISYNDMLERMPFWLKPTGAFGIGLQSVFLVVDSFKIQTKSEGEQSKEVIFRSAKKGKYSSLSGIRPIMKRGTKIIINIPKERFPDAFGTSFSLQAIDGYDYFTDTHRSIYIPKLRHYITSSLNLISNLRVDFFGERQINNFISSTGRVLDSDTSSSELIFCSLTEVNNNLVFDYSERIIGSKFSLNFAPYSIYAGLNSEWNTTGGDFYVRDILVEGSGSRYYVLEFPKLTWNLMSPESDKLLNISRDKFLPKLKSELENKFLKEVLPDAIELALRQINKNEKKIIELYTERRDELALLYFKLYITCLINKIDIQPPNPILLHDEEIPGSKITTLGGQKLKMHVLFEVTEFVISNYNQPIGKEQDKLQLQKDLVEKTSDVNSKELYIIWELGFLKEYLRRNFHIYKIHYYDCGEVLYLKKGVANKIGVDIACGENIYLQKFKPKKYHSDRPWNYASNKYSQSIIITRSYPTWFVEIPTFNNQFIISPFHGVHSFSTFKAQLLRGNSISEKEDIEEYITNDLVLEYITPSLIDWIIENRIDKREVVNKSEIIDGYRKLMADLIKA